MNNILVSIIIPTYNIEEYIGTMLQDVFHQTYGNLEVIVVDDGSTDKTPQLIADAQTTWGGNLTLLKLPHKGVSVARNAGIELAKGKKIFFWDGDDRVEPTAIADCLEFSEKFSVNAVLYGYANRQNGVNDVPKRHDLKVRYTDCEIVKELLPHFLGHSFIDINKWIFGKCGLRQGKEHTALWRIMLDADTIKNNNLRFCPSLSLGEDTQFINKYLLYESSVGFLDKCLYYLTTRQTGANIASLINADKRMSDKMKLIDARSEIDSLALSLHGVDTHVYWEGTMVLSLLEMCIRLSLYDSGQFVEKYGKLHHFSQIDAVRRAVDDFHPAAGLKAVPFWIVKYGGLKFMFGMLNAMPRCVKRRIVNF